MSTFYKQTGYIEKRREGRRNVGKETRIAGSHGGAYTIECNRYSIINRSGSTDGEMVKVGGWEVRI